MITHAGGPAGKISQSAAVYATSSKRGLRENKRSLFLMFRVFGNYVSGFMFSFFCHRRCNG
jgi:hypothetical protein